MTAATNVGHAGGGRTGHANFRSHPDNWLHLISALAGLAIALWPARRHETAAGGTTGAARSY